MKPFHFKEFSVYHHKSTMKVGTDAILLGSWIDVENASRILDIGTGCGVIALLIASRCNASIDAIEWDINSAQEAKQNFENSKFSNRMRSIHADFKQFAFSTEKRYDLIVSNPPFFSDDLLPFDSSRKKARHTLELSHQQLLQGVDNTLSSDGRFCIVLPFNTGIKFIETATPFGIFPNKKLVIYPKKGAEPNRINIEFNREPDSAITTKNMIIREDNNDYSEQYKSFVINYLASI